MKLSLAPELQNVTFRSWIALHPEQLIPGVEEARAQREYLPWRRVQHVHPEAYPAEVWWSLLQMARDLAPLDRSLVGIRGKPFFYANTPEVQQLLYDVDRYAGYAMGDDDRVDAQAFSERRRVYLQQSRMLEAISSSQLEGAATTRAVAKQMLAEQRPPRDASERMIANNYATIQSLERWKDEPLSHDLLCRIHRSMTKGILDEAQQGRYRTAEDEIAVKNSNDEVVHLPPPAEQLPERLEALFAFANRKTAEQTPFLHPVLKAMALHTLLAYEHSFCDGNGRTARTLFYWSLLRDGYWLAPYISLSREIARDHKAYDQAYLDMEHCGLDLTYCLLVNLRAFVQGIAHFTAFVAEESIRTTDLRKRFGSQLSSRQLALLEHTLRHERYHYTVQEHRHWHDIVANTARADFADLVAKGYLDSHKEGRLLYFTDTGLFRRLVH